MFAAQMTDGTLRVALGDLGLSVDNATVASISRILAAREASDTPPLQVREAGAALLVDGVSVEANATATLSVDTKPREGRLGRARDGAPRAARSIGRCFAASLPLDRRSLHGPGDGLRPSGAIAASDFVVGEYTYQDGAPRCGCGRESASRTVRPRDGAAGRWWRLPAGSAARRSPHDVRLALGNCPGGAS